VISNDFFFFFYAFSALTLLVGRQEGWWGAGVVVCLEQGADLHMVQLMPLPLTVCCFSKIQIGFTFLVLADLGSPRKRAIKRAIFAVISRFICACFVYCFLPVVLLIAYCKLLGFRHCPALWTGTCFSSHWHCSVILCGRLL